MSQRRQWLDVPKQKVAETRAADIYSYHSAVAKCVVNYGVIVGIIYVDVVTVVCGYVINNLTAWPNWLVSFSQNVARAFCCLVCGAAA